MIEKIFGGINLARMNARTRLTVDECGCCRRGGLLLARSKSVCVGMRGTPFAGNSCGIDDGFWKLFDFDILRRGLLLSQVKTSS